MKGVSGVLLIAASLLSTPLSGQLSLTEIRSIPLPADHPILGVCVGNDLPLILWSARTLLVVEFEGPVRTFDHPINEIRACRSIAPYRAELLDELGRQHSFDGKSILPLTEVSSHEWSVEDSAEEPPAGVVRMYRRTNLSGYERRFPFRRHNADGSGFGRSPVEVIVRSTSVSAQDLVGWIALEPVDLDRFRVQTLVDPASDRRVHLRETASGEALTATLSRVPMAIIGSNPRARLLFAYRNVRGPELVVYQVRDHP